MLISPYCLSILYTVHCILYTVYCILNKIPPSCADISKLNFKKSKLDLNGFNLLKNVKYLLTAWPFLVLMQASFRKMCRFFAYLLYRQYRYSWFSYSDLWTASVELSQGEHFYRSAECLKPLLRIQFCWIYFARCYQCCGSKNIEFGSGSRIVAQIKNNLEKIIFFTKLYFLTIRK